MRAPALVDVTRRGLAALAALVVLVLIGFAAAGSARPPAARDAGAPAGAFSADRALAHVRRIAAVPHPVGSAAEDQVRDYLLGTLRGMGLSPRVQDTVSTQGARLSSSAGGIGLAHVRNIVTLIPGTASTGRVFLVAHYDSVQTGPGASDDGAAVAAELEAARALLAGPRPRNDVVLLMTDAEEACLCGAEAFVDQDELGKAGGVVLNMEARGSSGPAIMFETSEGNERLVDAYATVPEPVGTSFAVEIYRRLPNNTDFTAFRHARAHFAGLNSAFIDGAAAYHSPSDTVATMDRDSLQHHGDSALALLRELGKSNLSEMDDGHDATYFPAPGRLLVRYPGVWVWPIAILALAATLALAWLARRRGVVTGRRLTAAVTLAPVPIVAAPVLAQAYWLVLTLIRPGYAALPVDPYRPQWYRLAVLMIALAVVCAWFALLRRRIGAAALAIAGYGWLAVLGVVLAALTPGGSYLAAIPALAGALAGVVALLARGWWSVLAVTAGGAVAVIVLLPATIMLFPALGMRLGGAGAFLAALLGLALLPVVDLIHPAGWGQRGLDALRARRRGALPAAAATLAVVVFSAVGLVADRFDAAHPLLTQLMYALDADTGTAQWMSSESHVQKWTSQYVSGAPHSLAGTLPALGSVPLRTGKAQAASLPAPALTVESDVRDGDARKLTLRLTPQRPVRFATLHVDAAARVLVATVDGRPVPYGKVLDGTWGWGFIFHGPPTGGIEIQLTVRAPGAVHLRAMDGSDGLGALPGFHARPAGVGILGTHDSELVAVAKTYTF